MAKETKLTIPLNLEINRESYSKIAAAKKTDGNETMTGFALGTISSQLLDSYANGGLMLKPESVKQLEVACDSSFSTETQLVAAVQKAFKRDEGANVITVKIDDAVFPAIKEYAQTVGMTVQEVMDDMGHRMVRDSLAFYLNAQNYEPVIYMTEPQGRKLEALTGKRHMTGDDILNLVDTKQLVGA